MNNQLYCGAARIDITPDESELDGLFGLMGSRYGGIIDRLSMRTISLECGGERALIVAFDLDKAPEPIDWLPELAAHTSLAQDRIMYFSTHTHSGPRTTFRPNERDTATAEQRACMNRYEAGLKEKVFSCVDSAINNMKPARVGTALGKSYVNTNRNANFIYTDEDGNRYPFINEGMNWGAEVDRTLFTMRFEDLDGAPIALFINYPMHCCLEFLNNYAPGYTGITGDIAGNISTHLEEYFPGCVAIWSSGAAGDVDPTLFNVFMYPDPKDGHVVREPIPYLEVSLMQLRMIVGWHLQDIKETLRKITDMQDSVRIASAEGWSETPRQNSDNPYRIRMQTLELGDTVLVGIGGELYNSIGRHLKAVSPAKHTVIINHNASLLGDAGYILDDDTLARAAQDAPVPHGVPGGQSKPVPGTIQPSLEKLLLSMIAK